MENSQKIEVRILNAFVDNEQGGNPAGVVLNADNLTNEQKLTIANKVGLSETAFVSRSKKADFKLDFFTPSRQIAHCGHATIATFSYLSQLGKIKNAATSKETIDGVREILMQGDLAFMEQLPAKYSMIDQKRVLRSINLEDSDLMENQNILIVNTGNSFAIIPVISQQVLKNINPDFDLISQTSEEYDLVGYYAFCIETSSTTRDASTRMFAPRYGIKEEAGTGMAAGPLACYLYDKLDYKKERFFFEQGWFMDNPSPSLIIVDLIIENGVITKIMAGGKGIQKSSILIEI